VPGDISFFDYLYTLRFGLLLAGADEVGVWPSLLQTPSNVNGEEREKTRQ